MGMPVVARSDEYGSRLRPFPGAPPPPRGRWIVGAYQRPTAFVTAAKPSNVRKREKQFSSCSPLFRFGCFSREFGISASDLRQHVDQYIEIGGLYTFKQSMSLFVKWIFDDREQLLAL